MASPNMTKPAREVSAEPVSKVEQLGSGLDQSNTLSATKPQAPPDDRGESDFAFFSARPGIDSRVRLPFDGEVPLDLIEQGGRRAFIHVFIIRNSDGSPGTRARAVFYSEGGNA